MGRISAQIDELDRERRDLRTGHFGFLEAEDDPRVFAALFGAAESWLRERGIEEVIGPFNFTINQQETGLLVDGFEVPPMMLMGHARPYYGPGVEEQGYAKARDLFAYHLDITREFPGPVRRLLRRAERRGEVRIRHINMKRYREDIIDILEVFNDAWSDNWGFVPVTSAEIAQDAANMRPLIRDDIVHIAEFEGQLAGMMITLPNLNEMIADLDGRLLPFGWARLLWRMKTQWVKTARVVTMGVDRRFHGSALGARIALAMIEATRKNGVAGGIREAELSWILEDNTGMRQILEAIGGRIYKTYRVYSKTI